MLTDSNICSTVFYRSVTVSSRLSAPPPTRPTPSQRSLTNVRLAGHTAASITAKTESVLNPMSYLIAVALPSLSTNRRIAGNSSCPARRVKAVLNPLTPEFCLL